MVRALPRNRRILNRTPRAQQLMVDAEVLSSLSHQGIVLNSTSLDVLRLKGCESKKLSSLGILNLEQLATSNEASLLAIPHFGVLKVRRLKTKLNSYLTGLSTGQPSLPDDASARGEAIKPDDQPAIQEGADNSLDSTLEVLSELEAASQSLEKLKKRIHTYITEIRKNQGR